jgi:hypothetical protein
VLKVQIFLQPHLSHKCIFHLRKKKDGVCMVAWAKTSLGKKLGENSIPYIIGQPMFHEEDTTFVKHYYLSRATLLCFP